MTPTYWHMQIHPDDTSFAEENVHSILEHKKIIGLGDWEAGKSTIDAFRNDMKVNDIVAVKNGGQLIALVQVVGGWYEVADEDPALGWIVNRRPIRVLDWELDGRTLPQPRGTLERCVNEVETTKNIREWHHRVIRSFKKRKLDLAV
ncbi:pyruvate kinase [Pseudomonas shirazensis]|uniref:Pyruvate kinase n=1 Tax=Pseudomonas shirazensis TaxID=2745494 RepID=A0ABU8ZUH7_9PSED